MDGEVPEDGSEKSGAVSYDLLPTHNAKTFLSMKALYAVKRITFNPSEANPDERLEVRVPKLNKNEVLVPASLAFRFDIDLPGGHANNYLVKNVSRALVSQQVVKFGGSTMDDIVDYDIYKIFTELFLPKEKRGNMVAEGIQSKKKCLRSVQVQETIKPRELTLRTNWKKFTARSIASISIIRS